MNQLMNIVAYLFGFQQHTTVCDCARYRFVEATLCYVLTTRAGHLATLLVGVFIGGK